MPRVLQRLPIFCLLLLGTVAQSHEPPSGLLMHLPLDGSLSDASGNGFSADYIQEGGTLAAASPQFRQGRLGQSLYLDGSHGLRIPLDLAPEVQPRVTVTAWVYQEPNASGAPIFTHGHKSFQLFPSGGDGISLGVPEGAITETYALRPQRWVFVAAAVDTTNGEATLQIDRRRMSSQFDVSAYSVPYRDVWFGTAGDAVRNNLIGYRLDDLRIYDRVLNASELEGLALGQPIASDDSASGAETASATSAIVDCEGVYNSIWNKLDNRGDLRMAAIELKSSGCALADLKTWWDTRGEPGGLPPVSISWEEFEQAYREVGGTVEQAPSSAGTSGETSGMTPNRTSGGTTSPLSGSQIGGTNPTVEASRSLGIENEPSVAEGEATGDARESSSKDSLGGTVPTGVMNPVDTGIEGSAITTAADRIEEERRRDYERTGPPLIGSILGRAGVREFEMELSRGFVRQIGLGLDARYCGVQLNDEFFDRPTLEGRDRDCPRRAYHALTALPTARVSGMSACWDHDRQEFYRLRGLEIRGDEYLTDGSYSMQTDADDDLSDESCYYGDDAQFTFGKLSVCGPGKFATGVVLQVSEDDVVVGLKMICREEKSQ